jgi:hypothetical protein
MRAMNDVSFDWLFWIAMVALAAFVAAGFYGAARRDHDD